MATAVIAVFAVAPPAAEAQGVCTATVTVGTTTGDLLATSARDPLFIDLNTTEKPIIFEATAGGVERGTVEVSVVSFKPFDLFYSVEPGASVVYFGNIFNDHSLSVLGIDRSGPTGFVVTGSSTSSLPPPYLLLYLYLYLHLVDINIDLVLFHQLDAGQTGTTPSCRVGDSQWPHEVRARSQFPKKPTRRQAVPTGIVSSDCWLAV